MLNIEFHSAAQFFGLPYQHMMIDEDLKNVGFFEIESQSEDESTRDRSILHTQIDICSFLHIHCFFNVYRYLNNCASRVMQLCASQSIIYLSKGKLEFDFF